MCKPIHPSIMILAMEFLVRILTTQCKAAHTINSGIEDDYYYPCFYFQLCGDGYTVFKAQHTVLEDACHRLNGRYVLVLIKYIC